MSDGYRVDALAKADADLKAAIQKLPKPESLAALDVFVKIHRRLRSDPFGFCEELYDLKTLGVQIRLGVQVPIAIQFGVDHENQIVIIQTVTILR